VADVVLWIVPADGDQPAPPAELEQAAPLRVVTRCDLLPDWPEADAAAVFVSGKTGRGVDGLLSRIESRLPGLDPGTAASYTARQAAEITSSLDSLQNAVTGLDGGMPLDAAAQDLYAALYALDGVWRQSDTQAVITAVFSRFCVGK
jgi:tRNA modification GTPase